MKYQPREGDIVQIGKGKKHWRVGTRFWSDHVGGSITAANDPRALAVSLDPVDGFTSASAEVSRLTLVERPSDASGRQREGGGDGQRLG